MKITSKGQVTIPQDLREKFGYLPDTHIVFQIRDSGELVLAKEEGKRSRGQAIVEQLRGKGRNLGKSTDELMKFLRD